MRRILATCALAAMTVTAAASAEQIRWRSGTVSTNFDSSQNAAAQIAVQTESHDNNRYRHIVVQFDEPVTPKTKETLADAGLTLLNYVGDNAFFASVDAGKVSQTRLAAVSSLRAAMPIEQAWKLHPDLLADIVHPWMLAEPPADDALESTPAVSDNPDVIVYVLLHPDVDLSSESTNIAATYGAEVRSKIRSLNGMVLQIPAQAVKDLANEDTVQYIEPPLPKFSVLNDSNRARVGADIAQAPPYNLDGAGVTALVYDGGTVLSTHPDLAGRVRIGDSDALGDHPTHVAGTIGGDGTASGGLRRGMAPGVLIESYGFETGGPLEPGFLYTDPGDIEADYTDSIVNHGADISNNSIGTNTAPNGYPCEWEGNYGLTSATIDAIVRGSLGQPFRIVWANGNERNSGRCGTTYLTTAPPACAKNHIAVGAINSNDDSVTSFTSWGPTDDGRLKPDISAPGCQVGDDNGVTSTSSSGGYTRKCGTSMAAPTVTGISALILQDFRLEYPGEPDPRNSTLKSILAHTAVDIENPGPDFKSGYGSVRVIPAIETVRAGNFLESTIETGETKQFLVLAAPGDAEVKVTIAWDDAPGTPNVNPVLVNDLDLRVFDGSLNPYYPWTLNPASAALPAVRTQPNHVDNIEQVVIDNPAPGAYLIEIHGFNVPQGPQPFSLVATPTLINCSTQGDIKLDRDDYRCQAPMEIEVIDCDLNTDNAIVDTVEITVRSDTEPGGETVILTESGPETAQFIGAINVDTIDAVGVLQVTEGDTITATYLDEDDGFGGLNVIVETTAGVDCTPPLIADIGASNILPRSATVDFLTDEPTFGKVYYGEDCGSLGFVEEERDTFLSHDIDIRNLEDEHTYYYAVEAEDPAGNVAFLDNGGACYSFTTPKIPDYFTQVFNAGIGLSSRALLLAPGGGVDFYDACGYDTLVLPTDPTGGHTIALTDTGTYMLQLTGGAQVLLYGQSYNTLYINANGNITLDGADDDSTETIEEHFARPRIAGLWDDLDPSEGGQISYKQLSDRVAITWLAVPEDNAGNVNTFQIEMYFDGRIQFTWLAIQAADAIIGLSAGTGVPEDFESSDLGGFDSCGPRPPSAAGRTVIVGEGREINIELLSSDDGLPEVPGELIHIISALPTHELRDAGNDHVIVPGDLPYALTGGGKEVIYAAPVGFLGLDEFSFYATDGGTPPEGGDSNVATVTVRVDPVLVPPFVDDFAAVTPDEDHWAYNFGATVDAVGIDEPSAPYSLRLNGDPTGGDEIRSHFMDLSSFDTVTLSYAWQRTGGGNSPESGDNLYVEYATSNGSWTLLQQYAGDGSDMEFFASAEHSLPADALHDSFRLRFRSKGSASSAADDWFVDDVVITVPGLPLAFGQNISIGQDRTRTFTLEGADPDNEPIDFVIISLPSNGDLADPQGGVIADGDLPYTLLAQGDTVTYTPAPGYLGPDEFQFRVTDGASFSNFATVHIMVEPVLDLPFEEEFPTPLFDSNKWAEVYDATIDVGGLSPPSPPYSLRLNGSAAGDSVTTYAINLENATDVYVSYNWQRTGDGDSPEPDEDLFVEYLDVEGVWELLAQYPGDGPDMSVFSLASHPINPADAHPDFRLRFRTISTSNNIDDWFVDNIRVYSANGPTAYDQSAPINKFGAAYIDLLAEDPNLDPLEFQVESLPAIGTLVDADDNHTIVAQDLPYTLTNGGATLRYWPPLGWTGAAAFTYRATDGFYYSNFASVSITVGGELPVHSFLLESDPGWATEGDWAFGQPLGMSLDPASGYTGANVYGYNLAGPYGNNINPPHYLTTAALDFTNVSNAEIRFYRWLGVEQSDFDHATIEASNDGLTWQTIWEHDGLNLVDQEWSLQSYDISAVADNQPAVYIRWGMGPTDDSATFAGWNVDDINFFGDVATGPGDVDQDGDVDDVDFRAFQACLAGPETSPTPPAPMIAADCLNAFDLTEDGDVDLADFAGFAVLLNAD